jgi:hypothetical protein
VRVFLSPLEKLGLRIAALIHEGALPSVDCELCQLEGKQEERNCEGRTQEEVVMDHPDLGELTACPMKYVSPAISEFLEKYKYVKTFMHTAPNFEDCDPRFWECWQHYEDCKAEAMQEVRNSGGAETTSAAINSIANRFKDRKQNGKRQRTGDRSSRGHVRSDQELRPAGERG